MKWPHNHGQRYCKICKEITFNKDSLCDGCWEVISRLDDFLSIKKGREYILNKIKEIKNENHRKDVHRKA